VHPGPAPSGAVFGDIAKARSALLSAGTPAEKIAANNQLDGAIGRLLMLVENYPQLKSNENFMRLQDELAGTESRIAVERKRYNAILQDYNTYIPEVSHFCWVGRVQAQRCLLQGGRGIARGAEGEFRDAGLAGRPPPAPAK